MNDNVDPRSGVHRERRKKGARKQSRVSNSDDEAEMEGEVAGPSGAKHDNGVVEAHGRNVSIEGEGKDGAALPYMQPVFDQEGNRIAYTAWPGYVIYLPVSNSSHLESADSQAQVFLCSQQRVQSVMF